MEQKNIVSDVNIYSNTLLDSSNDVPFPTDEDDDPVFVVTRTKLGSFRSVCYNIPKSSVHALEGHKENITNGCESIVIYRGIIKMKYPEITPKNSPVMKYIIMKRMLADYDYSLVEEEDDNFNITTPRDIGLDDVRIPDDRFLLVWHDSEGFGHTIYNKISTKTRLKCERMKQSAVSFGLVSRNGIDRAYYYFHNEEWRQKLIGYMKDVITNEWNERPIKKYKKDSNLSIQSKNDSIDVYQTSEKGGNKVNQEITVNLPTDQIILVYHDEGFKIRPYYTNKLKRAKTDFDDLKTWRYTSVLISGGKVIDEYYYEPEWRNSIIRFINEKFQGLINIPHKRKRDQIESSSEENIDSSPFSNELKDILVNHDDQLSRTLNYQNDLLHVDTEMTGQTTILEESSNEATIAEFENNMILETTSESSIKEFNLTDFNVHNGTAESMLNDRDARISLCPTPSDKSGLLGMDHNHISFDRASSTYSVKSEEEKIHFNEDDNTRKDLTHENLTLAAKMLNETQQDNTTTVGQRLNSELDRTDSSYAISHSSDSQKDGYRTPSDMPSLVSSTKTTPDRKKRPPRIHRRPKDKILFVWCEDEVIKSKTFNKSEFNEAKSQFDSNLHLLNSCLLLTTTDDQELYSYYYNNQYEVKIKDAMNRLIREVEQERKSKQ